MRLAKFACMSVLSTMVAFSLNGVVQAQEIQSAGAAAKQHVILAKYTPAFKQLESNSESTLNKLASDFLSHKLSLSTLLTQGVNLQNQVNTNFYQLLGQMKIDLSKAGLPMDLAIAADNEYKLEINKEKAKLIASFLQHSQTTSSKK